MTPLTAKYSQPKCEQPNSACVPCTCVPLSGDGERGRAPRDPLQDHVHATTTGYTNDVITKQKMQYLHESSEKDTVLTAPKMRISSANLQG